MSDENLQLDLSINKWSNEAKNTTEKLRQINNLKVAQNEKVVLNTNHHLLVSFFKEIEFYEPYLGLGFPQSYSITFTANVGKKVFSKIFLRYIDLTQRSAAYFGSRAGFNASQTLSGHKI